MRKFARNRSVTAHLESTVVRHNGRGIRVFRAPIPTFYGEMSESILQMAAARAYSRGWRKVIVTWVDNPIGLLFDDDRCFLSALNPAMYRERDSLYRHDQILCEMTRSGEPYDAAGESRERLERARNEDDWAHAYAYA